jgi:uncharacterized protein
MIDPMSSSLDVLLKAVERDARVLAVLLYGSEARNEARSDSDTDVCLVLGLEVDSGRTGSQVQLDHIGYPGLDVRVFQRLPLYVRQRVLKDGKVLFVRNEDELYELAFRTIRSYEEFRPFYLDYLQQTANA